jgi:hypothetical protein
MATRRRLSTMGYGPSEMPRSSGSNFPLPPPPDGTIPVRLPAPGDPNAQPPQGEGMMDESQDPMAALRRLLESANKVPQ